MKKVLVKVMLKKATEMLLMMIGVKVMLVKETQVLLMMKGLALTMIFLNNGKNNNKNCKKCDYNVFFRKF